MMMIIIIVTITDKGNVVRMNTMNFHAHD